MRNSALAQGLDTSWDRSEDPQGEASYEEVESVLRKDRGKSSLGREIANKEDRGVLEQKAREGKVIREENGEKGVGGTETRTGGPWRCLDFIPWSPEVVLRKEGS